MSAVKLEKCDLEPCFLSQHVDLKTVIICLNNNELKIAILLNEKNQLIGTVTDGDIRRGLLNGCTMDDLAYKIANRAPIVASHLTSTKVAADLMEEKCVLQIPLVDDGRKITGLMVHESIAKLKDVENLVVIMAGGFGKRLYPLTKDKPKPMVSVFGKPMLEHLIIKLKSQGFKNFLISVFYLSEIITDYFGDGAQFGVNIQYISEDVPLGTAGCLSLIEKEITAPFLVLNADVQAEVDYRNILEFNVLSETDATIGVRPFTNTVPFGVVNLKDKFVTSIMEKPEQIFMINAGIYVLSPRVFRWLRPDNRIDMPELLNLLVENERNVNAYHIYEDWADIGQLEDLQDYLDSHS